MEQPAKTQSNKTTRTVLIILGVLVVICCLCGIAGFVLFGSGVNYFMNEMYTEDSAEVQQIAAEMLTYDLPPGYQEQMAVNLFGIGDMVLISNENSAQVIAFLQMNSALPIDVEQVREQMLKNVESSVSADFVLVDEWDTVIRDQQVTVLEYEGSGENNVPLRQLTTVFEGESGSIFMIVTGAQSTWNQAEINDFFASIR